MGRRAGVADSGPKLLADPAPPTTGRLAPGLGLVILRASSHSIFTAQPSLKAMSSKIVPLDHQPALPERLLCKDTPDDEAMPMDVVVVGGGAAGLATAIELAQLVKASNEAGNGPGEVEIAVLEKSGELGQHSLSGAVMNMRAIRELFPKHQDSDFPFLRTRVEKERVYMLRSERKATKLPTPPTMKNHGNYVISLSEMVRWLGEQAEGLGVNVFTGFPVDSLLIKDRAVQGVRTTEAGLDRDSKPGSNHQPAMDLLGKVTVLAEGTRGPLTQSWLKWQNVTAKSPQIYALGVKEVWEVKKPLDHIVHTLGWPLPKDAFGGSWMYPMSENLISIGLVVGMDYGQSTLDVHELLQKMKSHPLFHEYLADGELDEWGAKTIPEGGYYALTERRTGDGLVVVGDSAGLVDVPSLKGIHYAIQSGIFAARSIFAAFQAKDFSQAKLSEADRLVNDSYIVSDMRKTRNMRLAFKSGFWSGGLKAGLMTLTGGRFPGKQIQIEEDAADPKTVTATEPFTPDGKLTFSKVDAVFKSGNATRDTVPTHLIAEDSIPEAVGKMYASMCPAAVYEWKEDGLVINAPNCVDCKATDVIGPRWTPREGGSGPKYRRM